MLTTLISWSVLGFIIGFIVGISHLYLDKTNLEKYIGGGIAGSIAGGLLGQSLVYSSGFVNSSILYALIGAFLLSFYLRTNRQF